MSVMLWESSDYIVHFWSDQQIYIKQTLSLSQDVTGSDGRLGPTNSLPITQMSTMTGWGRLHMAATEWYLFSCSYILNNTWENVHGNQLDFF